MQSKDAKVKYRMHKCHAAKRGIEFLLTFEEWVALWKASGRWGKRGRGSDEYCMARFGDSGPYAVGNVQIITGAQNRRERVVTVEGRAAISAALTGNKHSEGLRRSKRIRKLISKKLMGHPVSMVTRDRQRFAWSLRKLRG